MRALLFIIALIWPSFGAAQYWATREVCTVEQVKIHPAVFDPPGLGELKLEAAKYVNGKGRFWRITAPGGGGSHLWGTMHSNDPIILDLPDKVMAALEQSRIVAPEFDSITPTRRAYERDLTREDWRRPVRAGFKFDSSGIDPVIVDWIRSRTHGMGWGRKAPDWLTYGGLAELILSNPCNDFAMNALPSQDGRIQMLGMIAGADVLGLESPEALREYLDDDRNEATAKALIAVYGAYLNPKSTKEARATSFALYRQGRIGLARAWDRAYLATIFGAQQAGNLLDLTDDYLLSHRNRNFLETALPDLRDGGLFMAVGAFHISGEQGLVALLQRAGFAVSRISLPGEVP